MPVARRTPQQGGDSRCQRGRWRQSARAGRGAKIRGMDAAHRPTADNINARLCSAATLISSIHETLRPTTGLHIVQA